MKRPRHVHICDRCAYAYPEDVLLSPVIGSNFRGEVCGLCALELVNEVHGTRMQTFHGEMAEQARLDAKEARRNGTAKLRQAAAKGTP